MVREEFSHSPGNGKLFALTGYQICIICDASEQKKELGTGFLFMRRDWIVTAAHVVQTEGQNRDSLFARFTNYENNELQIRVLAIHKENDIAILQITDIDNPCKQPLYPGYDELSVTHGLVCCGYTPSNNKTITVSLAKVYSKDYRERQDIETIIEFESDSFEGGSSGGPIFGNGGVVLGIMINLFSIESEPNKVFARATSIQNLTKAMRIDFDTNVLESYIDSNSQS